MPPRRTDGVFTGASRLAIQNIDADKGLRCTSIDVRLTVPMRIGGLDGGRLVGVNGRCKMRQRKRLGTLLLGLVLGLTTAAAVATPAQAAWSDCPQFFSCYWNNTNGNGTLWTAPGPGWHNLPRQCVSVWNRGAGVIDWYVGSSYTGWSSAVGFQGFNPAPGADRIFIHG
jgi:Peptidase inhibitor family I36